MRAWDRRPNRPVGPTRTAEPNSAMNDLRIGQHVITEHGNGTVAAITDSCAATDILRYRVVCGAQDHWFYLDELIAIDNEPPAPRQFPRAPTGRSDTSGHPTRWGPPMCRSRT